MNLFIRFATAVGNVLYPRIASLDNWDQINLITQSIRISLIINSIIVFILVISIDVLVRLIYGNEYYGMVLYLYFMFPSALILIQGLIMEQYINGRGDFKLKVLLNIVSCLGLIITLIIFIDDLKNIHIAIAISISNIMYTIAAAYVFVYKYKIDIKKMIPTKIDLILIFDFINSTFNNLRNTKNKNE
jgi:O-antigen/teichoic acid export membrane protein